MKKRKIITLAKRLEIVRLFKDEQTYETIATRSKTSLSTVARVIKIFKDTPKMYQDELDKENAGAKKMIGTILDVSEPRYLVEADGNYEEIADNGVKASELVRTVAARHVAAGRKTRVYKLLPYHLTVDLGE